MSHNTFIKYYNKFGGSVYTDYNGDTVHLLDENNGEYSRINLDTKTIKHWYALQICDTVSDYIERNNLQYVKVNILIMGVALGGIIIHLLNKHLNIYITGIDISDEYFNFVKTHSDKSRLKLKKEDAMMYVNYNTKKYDIIICDIFNGINLPDFVMNSDFFSKVNRIMKPNGLFLLNTINISKNNLHNKLSRSFNSNVVMKSNDNFELRSNTLSIVNTV